MIEKLVDAIILYENISIDLVLLCECYYGLIEVFVMVNRIDFPKRISRCRKL